MVLCCRSRFLLGGVAPLGCTVRCQAGVAGIEENASLLFLQGAILIHYFDGSESSTGEKAGVPNLSSIIGYLGLRKFSSFESRYGTESSS
jgi:hypothetical protein